MNRNYYKQGQSSKVPYLLVIIIISLLWIMNGIYEDTKDTNKMYNELIKEFPKKDSLENKDSLKYKREKDSLITIIEWYRTQKVESKTKSLTYIKKRVETPKIEEDSL